LIEDKIKGIKEKVAINESNIKEIKKEAEDHTKNSLEVH